MKNIRNYEIIIFAVLINLFACTISWADSDKEERESFFKFSELVPLPVDVKDPFVGRHGNNLLVIGGLQKEGGQQSTAGSVYVLPVEDEQAGSKDNAWKKLPLPGNNIYGGAAVNTATGVICVGGYEAGAISQKVTKFSVENGEVKAEALPEIPVPIANLKSVLFSNRLYVAGGDGVFTFDMLSEDKEWTKFNDLPGGDNVEVVALAGVGGDLYMFTRKSTTTSDALNVLKLKEKQFLDYDSTQKDVHNTFSAGCGQAHILFISKTEQNNEILAYHTITKKWVVFGELPVKLAPLGLSYGDLKVDIIANNSAINLTAVTPSTKYGWIDHGVVALFMIGMLVIGTILSKREKNTAEFFRGGKRIPWWASGLALFATGASAISLMAMPGKAFYSDWYFMGGSIYAIVLFPIVICIYMPVARRLKVATANEYLELRYNVILRTFGSVIWGLTQMLGRMGAIMILPAIAISSITGIDINLSIIIMGVVTTIYVYLGGLEGVVWTEVMQSIVMISAVIICTVMALCSLDMSFTEAWVLIQSEEKLEAFHWGSSIYDLCAMVMFLNVMVATLSLIGDQNFIQRVQCTPTEKDAKKAVITQLAVAVPINLILFSMGTILYLYYCEKPELLSPAIKSDGIFPLFAAQHLPTGIAGLVIAAILAATMSTVASALSSVSNLGVEDFYRRFCSNVTDYKCLVLGKVLTAVLGVIGTVTALFLANAELQSIWDLFMVIFGLFMGALTGIYTLGIFTKRANSRGVIIGAVASLALTAYTMQFTHIHFLMYPVVGILSCVGIGYLFSIILPGGEKDIDGLTVYTLAKKED